LQPAVLDEGAGRTQYHFSDMFSYIDDNVKKTLLDNGKIRHVQGRGVRLSMLGPIPMPVIDPETCEERVLRWYPFVRRTELEQVGAIADDLKQGRSDGLVPLLNSYMCVNSLLLYGDVEQESEPLVRLHSCCMTGDVFGSLRCECGPQLQGAFAAIFEQGSGAMVYMASHEGRGIGMWAKGVTYILQDMGQDTYQANESLGLPADSRDFTDAALALGAFLARGARIRLLTNNPMKVDQMEKGGIEVAEVIPLVAGVNRYNLRYLHSKRSKGHEFGGKLPDLDPSD
jgi:GTP cyclohydrolase II